MSIHAEALYACRALRSQPGLVASATVTLALGIGAAVALWSLLDGVLLEPVSYPEPEQLVWIQERNVEEGIEPTAAAPASILAWREAPSMAAVAGWWVESTTLLGDGHRIAEEAPSARVTEDFFTVVGVEPQIGRVFDPEEVAREERVVVLSHGLWQRRLAGDPGAIGATISAKDGEWRVLGVMPPGFAMPGARAEQVLLWKPWDFRLGYSHLPEVPRDHRFVQAAARLAAGATLEDAERDLALVASALAASHPDTNHGWGVEVVPFHEQLVAGARPVLRVLLGAVVAVWLLACANVAGLLLVRACGRRRELALRSALGASRFRLIRQLIVESLLLAGAGGALGIAVATMAVSTLVEIAPTSLPRLDQVGIDGSAIALALAATLLTGLATGLAPVFGGGIGVGVGSPDLDLRSGFLGQRRPSQRLRSLLVVAEVAAALVLLAGSGLLLRSLDRLQRVDLGFDPEDVLVVRMRLDADAYRGRAHAAYRELVNRLRALPGVEAAGGATGLPFDPADIDFDRPYWLEGEPRPRGGGPGVQVRMVMVDYFETLRIPLLAGRHFDSRDGPGTHRKLIVNESMARRAWPDRDPIGRRLYLDYQSYRDAYEVVGVVGDTRFYGHRSSARPAVYMPHAQNAYLPMNLVVRGRVPVESLVEAVRAEVLAADPTQPVHSLESMETLIGGGLERDRFVTALLAVFAVLSLVLSAIGLYGVVAYRVSRSHRELGLRLALGARASDLRRLVVGGGLALAATGVAIGLPTAWLASRLLDGLLFEVSALDMPALASASLALLATVLVASWLPARRIARIDPATSLRSE